MKRDTKKIVWHIFLMYSALNVINYTLAHIAYLFENDVIGAAFEYISYYTTLALDFLAIPMLATVMLVLRARESAGRAFVHMILISTARIFYTLPYYYVAFIYNYRYDSLESILFSLVASVAIILISALVSIIYLAIAVHFLVRKAKKNKSVNIPTVYDVVKTPTTSDFLSTSGLPLTVFSLLSFGLHGVKELIDTVSFFIEYRLSYTAGEIVTILLNYVLLFLLLIAAYNLCARLKNRLAKYEIDESLIKKSKRARANVKVPQRVNKSDRNSKKIK
ncbi:MAG: hypothetical protein IKC61_05570 [Clostridia bacterium]|nr:hypothetical protein [Clostridia bacterium]